MNKPALYFTLIFITAFTYACTLIHSKNLKREAIKNEDIITGSYSLILYGGRHMDDIETIAVLDYEGDEYEFVPYAPEYDYLIKKGLSARDAIDEANRFITSNTPYYFRSQLSRIVNDKGNTLGYELRPLYHLFRFGRSDVLNVNYSLKGNKVMIFIWLKHHVDIFERGFGRDGIGK